MQNLYNDDFIKILYSDFCLLNSLVIDIIYAYFHLGPIAQTDGDAPADDIMSDHLAGFVLGLDGLAYLGKTGF